MVYKSMLLPLLEYGDVLVMAASVENRKRLQTLQNKGLRCALNKNSGYSSDEVNKEAGLQKLNVRREEHLLNFMYKWSKDPKKLKNNALVGVSTRSSKKKLLKIKKPRTEKYKRSFAYCGPIKWNSLPENFHQAGTKEAFKLLTRDWSAKPR